jgi:hypothetical protein
VTPPRRNQPNDRTQRTAARLLAIAPRITELVEHYHQELGALGYPASSSREKVRGGQRTIAVKHWDNGEEETDHVPVTSVEVDGIRASQLTASREDLRDLINTIEAHSHALVRFVHYHLGIPQPNADGEALCCDRQRGRDGVLDWGDPLCNDLPLERHGLCPRCLKRESRWRANHGLPFRGEPAA